MNLSAQFGRTMRLRCNARWITNDPHQVRLPSDVRPGGVRVAILSIGLSGATQFGVFSDNLKRPLDNS